MEEETQVPEATGDAIDQIVASLSPEAEASPEAQPEVDEAQQDANGDQAKGDVVDQPVGEPKPEPEPDQPPLFDNLSQDEIKQRALKYAELEAQHKQLVSSMGRTQSQFGETRKELDQLKRQWQEREERERSQAETMKLSPYNRKHPDYQKWQSLQSKAREDRETLSRITDPDVRKQLENAVAAKYSEQDQQLLMGYQGYLEEQINRFSSGPEDFVLEVMEQRIPAIIQHHMQAVQEYGDIQRQAKEFTEKNADLVGKYGQEILDLINTGIPARVATELVDLRHRNERLAETAGGAAEQHARSKAQQDSITRRAKIPTSSMSAPVTNLAAGVPTSLSDDAFIDQLVSKLHS